MRTVLNPTGFRPPATAVAFRGAGAERNRRIDRHLALTETDAFKREFEETLNRAKTWIASQKQNGQTGFVIFDIDETVLDNRGYFRDPQQQFYKKGTGRQTIMEAWDRWVQLASSPPLAPTLKLIEWLERERIPYCFLTGIDAKHQAASIANLRKAGAWRSNCLGAVYKPSGWPGNTTQFKKEYHARLEREYQLPVMASLGDRPGDMTEDPRKNFLLPSYVIALRRENDN